MANQPTNTLPVIVLMTLTLLASIFFSRNPEPVSARADVTQIPKQRGSWRTAQDVNLDENVMRQINADSYIDRWYVNPAGQAVELLVVYRRYGRREFAHRPELCFPAAGYTLTQKAKTDLFWGGRNVPAVSIKADGQDGSHTNLAYFFASGKKTEEDFLRQQLWMAFERVIPNKNGWTFIRLQSPRITTDEDALAAQKDFLRTFAPAIEAVITTDTKGNTPVATRTAPVPNS